MLIRQHIADTWLGWLALALLEATERAGERASERDIDRRGCEVGSARVRALIMRRLQEIVDRETL